MRRWYAALFTFALLSVFHVSLASAAGPITSGQSVTGSIAGPSYQEVWTFTGTAGDRILISAAPTGGTLVTQIRLSNPSSSEVLNTTAYQTDYKLLASGTYTLTIQDQGLSHTGTYSLTFIDITSGSLTSAGDADGGAIASAATVTGQVNAVTDLDAFTFSGVAGNRVLIDAVATSGPSFNTTLFLYPPSGGAAEVITYSNDGIDAQLAATGTYTVVVADYASTHTGGYSMTYLNLSAGPLTSGGDPDGGPITSAQVKSGGFQVAPDFDAYTFTGTAGNRILITTMPTGGTSTPLVSLYPPGGGPAVIGSSGSNRNDYQLLQSGTYTIVINDNGLNDTGTYDLSLLNITAGPRTAPADSDGTTIFSNTVRTGTTNTGVDMDAFTFSGVAGDRVVIGALATGGSGYNTSLALYPPGGGPAEVLSYSGDRIDTELLQSGIYTIEVEDYALTHSGTYSLSFMNVTEGLHTSVADPDGDAITSGQVKTGSFQTTPDFDVYTFDAAAGNRVILDAVPTGGTANPYVYIYPPGGGAAVAVTGSHRLEYQVPTTGTYSVLIEDAGLNETGTYEFTMLNVTAGPLTTPTDADGGPIASAQVKTGQMNAGSDMDAFTFTGTLGDRVLIGALATGGAGFNSSVTLYPPGGGPPEVSSYSGDRLDWQLQSSGTYTVVVEDYANTHPGTYSLSLLDVTAGPLTGAGDSDGGTIASGEVKTASYQTAPDFDAWRVTGSVGDRFIFVTNPTGGTGNTYMYLYPPNGGAAVMVSGSHRAEYQLPASGTYTLVVQDNVLSNSGTTYDLSILNLTSGPLTTGADADGGPITAAVVKSGQMQADVDMDAYTFSGNAGDRVLIGCPKIGGGTLNTTTTLYPPGGGPAEAIAYSADRLEWVLQLTGTYTIVVEDYGNAHTGNYNLMMLDLTTGPLTAAGDADGGIVQPGDFKSAQFQTIPDFDAYRFEGAFGDTVRITTTPTGGTAAPYMYIYGPTGAVLFLSGSASITYVLPSRSIFTLVYQDQTLANTGSYNFTFQRTGGYTDAQGPATPRAIALAPAAPNPFSRSTDVAFELPVERAVTLRVFDVRGALVQTLADGRYPAGRHDVHWNGLDARGSHAPNGVYWVELDAGRDVLRRKLVHVE